jgi:hypothetical protein
MEKCPFCNRELDELTRRIQKLESENAQLRDLIIEELDNQVYGEDTYVASKLRPHFHRPSCKWVRKINKDNHIELGGHEEAVSAGFKPCKTCCA